MAWLGPAPALANDAFAGVHALGEGLGCRGHGTVAGEVGVIFGAEAFDDVGACGLVVGVAQDERISEDAVFAIDVDGDLAGLGLAGGACALVSEADSERQRPRLFCDECEATVHVVMIATPVPGPLGRPPLVRKPIRIDWQRLPHHQTHGPQ